MQHSKTYLLRQHTTEAQDQHPRTVKPVEPFKGNALQWALMRVDEKLSDLEDKPPKPAQLFVEATRSPAGTAAAKGLGAAAQLTAAATAEAVKAAAPIGKWAVKQGLTAAMGLVTAAASSNRKQR